MIALLSLLLVELEGGKDRVVDTNDSKPSPTRGSTMIS